MAVELKVPSPGESITEVQIGKWMKQEGDRVEKDDVVAEIDTDKTTLELFAPAAGTLGKILIPSGEFANVGDVIGTIDEGTAGAAPAAPAKGSEEKGAAAEASGDGAVKGKGTQASATATAESTTAASSGKSDAPPPSSLDTVEVRRPDTARKEPSPNVHDAPTQGLHTRDTLTKEDFLASAKVMPAARRAAAEHGVELADVTPSGPGNRITKEDVVRAASRAVDEEPPPPLLPSTGQPEAQPQPAGSSREEDVVPMTMMRRRIAERLVQAQQNAAILTTFNDVDMSAVIELRNQFKGEYEKKYGIKLGFMSFFVKAAVEALKLVPQVNAEIRDQSIVYKNYYDIGVAIGGGRGLVVPIIRNAERLSFAEIEETIADFAKRAKENKLELDELKGGTFTISNGGIYGSMLSTPIINPPQSGILGLHAIQERPVGVNGEVVLRPMMYIAMSYDHRIIDGREAVTFLKRIKECIESPARILLEI